MTNPLTSAEQRAQRAEAAAKLWQCLCGLLCACVVGLGVLLSVVGQEWESQVQRTVRQELSVR
jgi:ABC-type Fe3+ transport system permease subunit